MPDNAPTWTFKEIDQAFGRVKGSAFIAFKRVRDQLIEGQDYLYYNGFEQPDVVEALKQQQRLYTASLHAVVLHESAYRLIAAYLQVHADAPPRPPNSA